jgi:uncharacterized SAM-binding protein YcdF (DUF218 family)
LVSGGRVAYSPVSLADAMKSTLETQFGVPVTWVENQSTNTKENARFSAELLRAANVQRIVLVTHAIHMPRALRLFKATGLLVLPAPTRLPGQSEQWPGELIPQMSTLRDADMNVTELVAEFLHYATGR